MYGDLFMGSLGCNLLQFVSNIFRIPEEFIQFVSQIKDNFSGFHKEIYFYNFLTIYFIMQSEFVHN